LKFSSLEGINNDVTRLLLFLIVFSFPIPSWSAWLHTTGLVTIPDAHVLPHLHMRGGLIESVSSEEPRSEENGVFNAGLFGRCELGIAVLSRDAVAGNVAVRLCVAKKWRPHVAAGVYNITTSKYVSAMGFGRENAFPDDLDYGDDRISERFSFFLVTTREFPFVGEITAGIGTGCFVGSGSYSKYLRVGDPEDDIQAGLIGGFKRTLPGGFAVMGDVNGRDVNVGLEWRRHWLNPVMGIQKVEYLLKDENHTRFTFGLRILYPRQRTEGVPSVRSGGPPGNTTREEGIEETEREIEGLKDRIRQIDEELLQLEADSLTLEGELSALRADEDDGSEQSGTQGTLQHTSVAVSGSAERPVKPDAGERVISFHPGQGAYLVFENHKTLEKVGRYLSEHEDARAYISCHPDDSPAHSSVYSTEEEIYRARAQSVKVYLMTRFEIHPNRIIVERHGWNGVASNRRKPFISIILVQEAANE
jgi:flagellar motor protein MotB